MADHGGSGRRYEDGCRCDLCRAAHRERVARRRFERWAERIEIDGRLVAIGKEHGKTSTYNNWGCRCTACTAANTRQTRVYR